MASTYSLNFWIAGTDPTLGETVTIADSSNVSQLLQEMKKVHPILQQAYEIHLYKASRQAAIPCTDEAALVNFDFGQKSLSRMDLLREVFPDAPKTYHIIAKVLDKQKKLRGDTGEPSLACWRNKTLPGGLPKSFLELAALLERGLENNEKIPIRDEDLGILLSSRISDQCTVEDVLKTFRISDIIPRPDREFSRLLTIAAARDPPQNGTESTYHCFWDSNIVQILQDLVPNSTYRRDTDHFTDTGKCGPDNAFVVDRKVPFRGEEKDETSSDDPKEKLVSKLQGWHYSPADYILGYYARGPTVTYAAIQNSEEHGAEIRISDLKTFNLRRRKDRIDNIRYLLHLSVVIKTLATVMGQDSVDEFQVLERGKCRIELMSTGVRKTYIGFNAEQQVLALRDTYTILDDKKVPNRDRITNQTMKRDGVFLTPRGVQSQPKSDEELRECIRCLLDTLQAAHQEPRPIFHRDIRWPNILHEVHDRSKWFLIDWEDASVAPTKAAVHMSSSTHSPAVFKDGHGAAVDIWGIGFLMQTCMGVSPGSELKNIGRRIKAESASLSVEDVRNLLGVL